MHVRERWKIVERGNSVKVFMTVEDAPGAEENNSGCWSSTVFRCPWRTSRISGRGRFPTGIRGIFGKSRLFRAFQPLTPPRAYGDIPPLAGPASRSVWRCL